jgi:hypothetical protein
MTGRNITDSEKEYYSNQKSLINSCSKEFISSAPCLFSNRISVQSLITRYELYKLILDVPGDIIECGVYQGNSLLWLAHLSVILEPFAINRRIHGFDTFEGFASIDSTNDPKDVGSHNFSDTDFETIKKSLELIDLLRPVNKIPRFNLVKGDICETLPSFIEENSWMTCAMLILDTDLYAPTKVALEKVVPIMPKGAVVVFDEYNYQNFPGETKALKEFINMNKVMVKRFRHESCLAYFTIE